MNNKEMLRAKNISLSPFVITSVVLVLFIYLMLAARVTHGRSPNEQSRIELSVTMAKFGSVSLGPVLSIYGTPFDRSERDGKVYSDKAPGLSFLGVPIVWLSDLFDSREGTSELPGYWILRTLLTCLLVTLPAALFSFFALGAFRSSPTQKRDTHIALLFALLTPLLTYSGVLFGHVPSGILAALAWKLSLIADEKNGQMEPSPLVAAMAGFLLALAITVEYPTAIVGFVLLSSMFFRKMPVRTLTSFVASCFVGLVPCLLYHQLAFGSAFTTGYAFKADSWHALVHQSGFFGVTIPRVDHMWGLLMGMKRGVLFYCPILALVPIGFLQMERQKKYSSFPYVLLGGIYLLFAAGFSDWQAGWSAAARHLVPCILIFIFPFAAAITYITEGQEKTKTLRWVLLCLAALSMVCSLLSVSLTPFFPEHFSSPLGQLVLPAMADGFFAPTFLSGEDLFIRGYVIGLIALLLFYAVTKSLFFLMSPLKMRFLVPVILLFVSVFYSAFIWGIASPLPEDAKQIRQDVLRDIGYVSQVRKEHDCDFDFLVKNVPRLTQ